MAHRPLEIVTEFPTPPSSATDPPRRSRWWTQLHSLFLRREELTQEEKSAICKPLLCTSITFSAFSVIIFFLVLFPCHVNFSVESISVSPSSLHVDFQVKNPSSLCRIYYNRNDVVYAKLGSLKAAVLETSHTRNSRGRHASFSVNLATESNIQSDVVGAHPKVFELDMKLSAKKKIPLVGDQYGRFDIRCQNLTLGYQKIKCNSSFQVLKNCCYSLFK